MTTVLFVLWIFVPGPWQLGPLPMTAGWVSGLAFDREADCLEVAAESRVPAVCRAAGLPFPRPLATFARAADD
jgi:hypothetical protein